MQAKNPNIEKAKKFVTYCFEYGGKTPKNGYTFSPAETAEYCPLCEYKACCELIWKGKV